MAVVQYKTPGVYIEELDAFPPSIVGVETAVPVFIGYTEKAEQSGRAVGNRPVRIASMVDFHAIFGGAPDYQFTLVPMAATAHDVKDAEDKAKAAEAAKDAAAPQLRDAANKLKEDFEKTPAGVAEKAAAAAEKDLDDAKKKTNPAATEAELTELTKKAEPLRGTANTEAAKAAVPRDVRIGDKDYGLTLAKRFYLYNSLRLFYANGGGSCYVVSVGRYADDILKQPLLDGLSSVRDLVGPTMLVIPEAVALGEAEYDTLVKAMLQQCYDAQDRVAILDVRLDPAKPFNENVSAFRSRAVSGLNNQLLKYGMAYTPFLRTSIVDPTELDYTNFEEFKKRQPGILTWAMLTEANRLYPDTATEKEGETKPEWKPMDVAPPAGLKFTARTQEIGRTYFDKMKAAEALPDERNKETERNKINQGLVAQIPALKDLYATMATILGILPPSPAMAGVYTRNDAMRGVWNAPANVGLTEVIGPTININTTTQDGLNMPIDGLAINAIRDFVGRGTLVWGARTLDGNSNDWRYIQVRRALIYIEQSVELALNKFVFEPNVAQTWVTVASMISSFLRGVWQAGGLMGASPAEAYDVQCGLGSTMTAQDVLEGRMIVQIKLQMVRPAEFIILTFQQKMQGGAG